MVIEQLYLRQCFVDTQKCLCVGIAGYCKHRECLTCNLLLGSMRSCSIVPVLILTLRSNYNFSKHSHPLDTPDSWATHRKIIQTCFGVSEFQNNPIKSLDATLNTFATICQAEENIEKCLFYGHNNSYTVTLKRMTIQSCRRKTSLQYSNMLQFWRS